MVSGDRQQGQSLCVATEPGSPTTAVQLSAPIQQLSVCVPARRLGWVGVVCTARIQHCPTVLFSSGILPPCLCCVLSAVKSAMWSWTAPP